MSEYQKRADTEIVQQLYMARRDAINSLFDSEVKIASYYMKEDTPEYYEASDQQYTIPNKNGDYSFLNERGMEYYVNVLKMIKENPYKIAKDGYIEIALSGCWAPDEDSKYYNENEDPFMCLNSWDNRVLRFTNEQGKDMTSSPIIFYGEDEKSKWAFTKSGSIYRYDFKDNA